MSATIPGQQARLSTVNYLSVTFSRDYNTGIFVIPTGTTRSLPEAEAKAAASAGYATINGAGSYEDSIAPDDPSVTGNGADVHVLETDSEASIVSKIETVGEEVSEGSPAGVGRRVALPASRVVVNDMITVSQAQSLKGVKGSTLLTLGSNAVLPDLGSGVGAFIVIGDDFRSEGGIAGQGVIEDLDIDARASQDMLSPTTIHGFYMPERAGDATAHTIRNVTVYGAKNNGIHIGGGNDKLVCYRMRQENSEGVGIYIGGSDCKASDIGSTATGSAMEIDSAAVEMDKFDLWRSSGANSDPTLKITGATNGCVIKSGTVEGKTLFIGKNESALNRYINAKAQFAFVHFKFDANQSPDCYFEAQSADMVELISCKFGISGNSVITPYDYLIKITNTGGADRDGVVKIIGGSGMLRFIGRPGATNKPRMDCLKHYCDQPKRVLFEWGVPGQVEIVPNWACDAVDPHVRTHVRFDGTARDKADFPFGYLAATIDTGGTLDDVNTTFTLPELPVLSSAYSYAMRVIP